MRVRLVDRVARVPSLGGEVRQRPERLPGAPDPAVAPVPTAAVRYPVRARQRAAVESPRVPQDPSPRPGVGNSARLRRRVRPGCAERVRVPWGPPRAAPLVRVASGRFRLHRLAASSPEGQLSDIVREGPATAEVFREFPQQIAEGTDRKMPLAADNCSVHRAKTIQEWLAANQAAVESYFQPTYLPPVNPVERLWALVQRWVSRELSKTKAQPRANLEAACQSLRGVPAQVQAFVLEADCKYILA